MASAEEIRANSYVGFDTITQQIEHKLLKRGFQFNIIVVGMLQRRFLSAVVGFADRGGALNRSDWSRKVDAHQHYLRVPPHRLEGPSRGG